MRAEIMAVGTELLLGDIVNTNSQYIAKELANLGISVYHHSVVGDNENRIMEGFCQAFTHSDLVITTGGLGPTTDDMTKEVAAQYFGKSLVLHKESSDKIRDFFKKIGRTFGEAEEKQAYFPKDAIILKNNNGTAPGCIMENNGKIIICLPGPPKEMIPMFRDGVIPYLKKYSDGVIESKVLRMLGIGESEMAQKIADIMENQTNPTVAPYAKDNDITLRITAKAKDEAEAKILIAPIEKEIRERLSECIYGEGDTTIEEVVGKLLIEKNLTISTAESCTGGLLAGRLINYPGISSSFLEGAVTYSNEAKIKRLGVKEDTLKKFGAVSEETAEEMARGIAKASGTDVGISVTGIAGPGGGTPEKPVGLVYVGLNIKGTVKVKKFNFPGSRETVRRRTVTSALDWLRRELLKL